MKFKRVYTGWRTKTMTQEQAADLPGVSARTSRRYIYRYTEDGLYDKRLIKASHRKTPLDEVFDVIWQRKSGHFLINHFYLFSRLAINQTISCRQK